MRVVALGQLGGRRRNHDEMLARGALNLFSAKPFFALQVLIAVRAGKFELAHAGSLADSAKGTMPRFVNGIAEDNCFPGLELHALWKRCDLPLWYIVTEQLDVFECTCLFPSSFRSLS